MRLVVKKKFLSLWFGSRFSVHGKFECHVLVAADGAESEGVVSYKMRSFPLRNLLA